MIPPLEFDVTVAATREHAFATWTQQLDAWWPRSHSVSGEPSTAVVLEPWLGGRIFERTADGVEHDWGEITLWEPPERFGYLWHLRRNRTDATDVLITFTSIDHTTTRVAIVHTGWERLGAAGQEWRDRNRGGWGGVLPHFVAAAQGGPRHA